MNCIHCQGKMKRGIHPFHVDRKGYHLTMDRIPAWVCSQCGEAYFDEAEVEAIQETLNALDQQSEKMAASG
jgi:YgiT-type zinc finger domain-containing protein